MFVIRSEPFSCAFLLAYITIVLRLGFALYGAEKISKGNNPLFVLVLFGMVTVVCLFAYVVVVLIKSIASAFSKK
jgi:hypothetical protein